jgi:hypothetical protein
MRSDIRVARTVLAIMPLLLLAACSSMSPPATKPSATPPNAAPQKLSSSTAEREFDALLARQDRVYQLIAPLIAKNAVLCKTAARPLLGFTAKNTYSFPVELRPAAVSRLKLGDALQVMQVLDGSGAMRAGIRRGDVLQSIQAQALPRGPQAETDAAKLLGPLMKNVTELDVSLLRNGAPLTLKVALTTACAFTVDIGNAPQVNAYSDGRRIMVTSGMLDSLSDQELAVILAREIAHNVQQHAQAMQMRATLAAVIDALLPPKPDLSSFAGSAGLKAMDEKLDQEADRLALYMLARAGLNPAMAIDTLEQLAQRYPATVSNSYTAIHPWTSERAALMRNTLTEIRQKQATKKALVP